MLDNAFRKCTYIFFLHSDARDTNLQSQEITEEQPLNPGNIINILNIKIKTPGVV